MASRTVHCAIDCSGAALPALATDLVVVPWFEGEGPAAVPGLDEASGGEVGRALGVNEFVARPYDILTATAAQAAWRSRRIAIIGAGARSTFGSDVARKLAAAAGLWARQRRVPTAAFVMRSDTTGGDARELAQALAEG